MNPEKIYDFIVRLTRKRGLWVLRAYTWTVAAGFFFLFPSRVRQSIRFYRVLFPQKGFRHHFLCAWGQYQTFAGMFIDRFLMQEGAPISVTSEGRQALQAAVTKKTGAVLLMSHLGTWEVAAHLMKRFFSDAPLLLYMGEKEKERMEAVQKRDLAGRGIRIIAARQDSAAAFDLIDGVQWLRAGGLVSIAGDLPWLEGQRKVTVRFLGHAVDLPEAPYVLAFMSGAPLFPFFAFRDGAGRYHVRVLEAIRIAPQSRKDRPEAIRRAAQQYADQLAEELRQRPLAWFHFRPFLGERLER